MLCFVLINGYFEPFMCLGEEKKEAKRLKMEFGIYLMIQTQRCLGHFLGTSFHFEVIYIYIYFFFSMEFSFLSFLDLVCVQRWLIFIQGFGYFHWFYKFTQFAFVSVFLLVCLLSQSEFCLFDFFFICFSLVFCFG